PSDVGIPSDVGTPTGSGTTTTASPDNIPYATGTPLPSHRTEDRLTTRDPVSHNAVERDTLRSSVASGNTSPTSPGGS
ncbi:MAG TPA: hypothetical protein VEJ87_06975, partial [Acidimicrobiales bacterium]|nr:hypothetical protein [Acidimicrobiales bacterium]